MIALDIRFGDNVDSIHGLSYAVLSFLIVPVWLLVLVCSHAYDIRLLGVGEDEYRTVAWASWWLIAVIAVVAYSFKIQFARGYVAAALPIGTVFLLVGRYGQRKVLHHRRKAGQCQHRVRAVGGLEAINRFAEELRAEPYLGLQLAGVCLSVSDGATTASGVPVYGSLT